MLLKAREELSFISCRVICANLFLTEVSSRQSQKEKQNQSQINPTHVSWFCTRHCTNTCLSPKTALGDHTWITGLWTVGYERDKHAEKGKKEMKGKNVLVWVIQTRNSVWVDGSYQKARGRRKREMNAIMMDPQGGARFGRPTAPLYW